MKQKLRDELAAEINSWQKAANYQGCPFKGYEKIRPHRKDHPKVFAAVLEKLKEEEYDLTDKSVIDIGSNIGYFAFALRLKGAGSINLVERQGRIQKAALKIIEIEGLKDVQVLGRKMYNVEQAQELPKCDIVVYKSVHHWIKKFSDEKMAEAIFNEITREASLVIYEPCNFGNALPTDADNKLAKRAGFEVHTVVEQGFKRRDVQVCLRSK
tara:strand:- start:584 stop:1219 length:636 start_codon:yes stop_codon:yes gene_type:complete